jgi:hypothetical protein
VEKKSKVSVSQKEAPDLQNYHFYEFKVTFTLKYLASDKSNGGKLIFNHNLVMVSRSEEK